MTYTLFKVHSFECDAILPDGKQCPHEVEDLGYKRHVWAEFAKDGWTKDGDKHYCPEHPQKEVVPDEPVAERRDLGASRQPVAAARSVVSFGL